MSKENPLDSLNEQYLARRGIGRSGRLRLIDAWEGVLDSKEPKVYTEPTEGLTEAEQKVLKEGGLRLTRTSDRDPISDTALEFAELVATSLSSGEAAKRIGVTPTRVRQLIGDGEIHSFTLNGKRLIPEFQIHGNSLVNNIRLVNRVLD